MPTSAAPTDVPVTSATKVTATPPPTAITLQLVQPPGQTKSATQEALQTYAPYVAAFVALLAVIVTAIYTLHKARMEARYTYASEILKFRLRQIEEFYAPAFLRIEQSRIVYEKLLWTIGKEMPGFSLDGFRLLDHIFRFKSDLRCAPLITRILETGNKLTELISSKSGLIEGGLTPTFIEYQAHFAIMNAASEQELSATEKEGWHEFGYYPRMLNREIREGFKVVLAHLENYAKAGDKTISQLLGEQSVEIGNYRRQLVDNLAFYEVHASDYADKFDAFDLSDVRQRFIEAIERTRSARRMALVDNAVNILDAGCGTGRDTFEFLKKGYVMTAIDASPAMLRECRRKLRKARREPENEQMKAAAEASMKRCFELTFDEVRFRSEFDGVWAAASLLHVPAQQMEEIVRKLVQALKPNGILFMSFKYGHGEYEYGARFYTYYAGRDIRALLRRIRSTEKIEVWLSDTSGRKLSRRKQWLAWSLEMIGNYDRSLWLNVMLKRRPA